MRLQLPQGKGTSRVRNKHHLSSRLGNNMSRSSQPIRTREAAVVFFNHDGYAKV